MLRWYSMSTFSSKASVVPGGLGDHRVVDDQLHRHQRVDLGRVPAQGAEGVAHGGQVDHAGHAGEVLHEHPLGGEGDLRGVGAAQPVALGMVAPCRHGLDVGRSYGQPVLVAEQVLQHHLDGVGEPGHVEAVGQRLDPVDLVGGVADGQVPRAPKESGGGEEEGVWAMTPFCSAGASTASRPRGGPGRAQVRVRYRQLDSGMNTMRSPTVQASDWMTQVAVGPPIIRARQAVMVTLNGW